VDAGDAALPTTMAATHIQLFADESATLADHVAALRCARERYLVHVLYNTSIGVTMAQSTKVRVLASCWGTGEREAAQNLLSYEDHFTVPVVLGALQVLDATRKAKQLDAKLAKFDQSEKKINSRPHKLSALKTRRDAIATLEQEVLAVAEPGVSGVSGALQRHVARWVRSIPKDKLEFWLLALPKEPWIEIAQLCHLNPAKDFKAVPWFLNHAFGEAPPAGTLAAEAAGFTTANLAAKATEFALPYSYVRRRFAGQIPDTAKVAMAKYMPLDQLIWYYEDAQDELATADGAVERILAARLAAGEAPAGLTAGKLLERLLAFLKVGEVTDADTLATLFPGIGAPTLAAALRRFNGDVERTAMQLFEYSSAEIERHFAPAAGAPAVLAAEEAPPCFIPQLMPHASRAMMRLSLPLEKPVFIMGDASASMQVAVSTSAILASLIAAVSDAGLCFFNTECIAPPVVPRTVEEVLTVAKSITADGATCPAAALWPLLQTKQRVRQLVLVSDEEENTKYRGHSFAELFAQYEKEISPGCRITFVSFLADLNAEGQMVSELRAMGYAPEQFKLHRSRPDLTKTDALLAVMSANTAQVAKEREEMEAVLRLDGLEALMAVLQQRRGGAAERGPGGKETATAVPVAVQAEAAVGAGAVVVVVAEAPSPAPVATQAEVATAAFLAGCGVDRGLGDGDAAGPSALARSASEGTPPRLAGGGGADASAVVQAVVVPADEAAPPA
jgi:hypothetical protein